jgi:hypothetical protein
MLGAEAANRLRASRHVFAVPVLKSACEIGANRAVHSFPFQPSGRTYHDECSVASARQYLTLGAEPVL